MTNQGQNLEILKYKLEIEKFQWEKQTRQQESAFLNKHFGVAITAMVSISAILVSYIQLTIGSNNAEAQLKNDKLKNDRLFYFETTKFLLEHQQEITASDTATVSFLRNVVVATFPREAAIEIASRMRDTAPTSDARQIWVDGLKYLLNSRSPPQ